MYKLRELNSNDLAVINKWRNDETLIGVLGATFRYIDEAVDYLWYESYLKSRSNTVRCAITEQNSDTILGLVSLTNIDHLNQAAVFHIMIGDTAFQKKGIGTFATNEILKHAFLNLNLKRIELSVLPYNTNAQKLYEKVGFIKEGIKRAAVFKNGEFHNIYLYGILKDDWLCNLDAK